MKYFPTQRQGSVATGVQFRAASAKRQLQNTTSKAAESSSAFFELRFREYIGLKDLVTWNCSTIVYRLVCVHYTCQTITTDWMMQESEATPFDRPTEMQLGSSGMRVGPI